MHVKAKQRPMCLCLNESVILYPMLLEHLGVQISILLRSQNIVTLSIKNYPKYITTSRVSTQPFAHVRTEIPCPSTPNCSTSVQEKCMLALII
jgi:hypothetical protein